MSALPWATLHMAKPHASAPWHWAKFCVGANNTDKSRMVSVFIGYGERRLKTVIAKDVGETATTVQDHANLECIGLLHAAEMGFTVQEGVEHGCD